MNKAGTSKTLAGHKEVAKRWLATLDFYKTELSRTAVFGYNRKPLGKDWAASVARAKHRIVARQITSAATEAALLDVVYLHMPSIFMSGGAPEFVTNGRLDWKKVTMMLPAYAVQGKKIARAVDRAMLNPHTVLGKRRLMREFESMR